MNSVAPTVMWCGTTTTPRSMSSCKAAPPSTTIARFVNVTFRTQAASFADHDLPLGSGGLVPRRLSRRRAPDRVAAGPPQALRARPASVRHGQHRDEQRVPARRYRRRDPRGTAAVRPGVRTGHGGSPCRAPARCDDAHRGLRRCGQRLARLHALQRRPRRCGGNRRRRVTDGRRVGGAAHLLRVGRHPRPDRARGARRLRDPARGRLPVRRVERLDPWEWMPRDPGAAHPSQARGTFPATPACTGTSGGACISDSCSTNARDARSWGRARTRVPYSAARARQLS